MSFQYFCSALKDCQIAKNVKESPHSKNSTIIMNIHVMKLLLVAMTKSVGWLLLVILLIHYLDLSLASPLIHTRLHG